MYWLILKKNKNNENTKTKKTSGSLGAAPSKSHFLKTSRNRCFLFCLFWYCFSCFVVLAEEFAFIFNKIPQCNHCGSTQGLVHRVLCQIKKFFYTCKNMHFNSQHETFSKPSPYEESTQAPIDSKKHLRGAGASTSLKSYFCFLLVEKRESNSVRGK